MRINNIKNKIKLMPTDFATHEEQEFWLTFNKVMPYIAETFDSVPLYWVDMNYRMLYLNEAGNEAVGGTENSYIGKTPVDFYQQDETGITIQKSYDNVLQSKGMCNDLHYLTDAKTGELKVFQATLDPIFNPETGNLIGVFGKSLQLPNEKLSHYEKIENNKRLAIMHTDNKLHKLIDNIYSIMAQERNKLFNEIIGQNSYNSNDQSDIKLTSDESDILYLLSMHKSPAEILQLILILRNRKITAEEVNHIITIQLYKKFNAHSITQLITNASLRGEINFAIMPVAL